MEIRSAQGSRAHFQDCVRWLLYFRIWSVLDSDLQDSVSAIRSSDGLASISDLVIAFEDHSAHRCRRHDESPCMNYGLRHNMIERRAQLLQIASRLVLHRFLFPCTCREGLMAVSLPHTIGIYSATGATMISFPFSCSPNFAHEENVRRSKVCVECAHIF